MKPSLHLFNPENDIALALDIPCFTPPKNAMLLAKAGELLPLWLAKEGDSVLVSDVEKAVRQIEQVGLSALQGVNITGRAGGFNCFSPWGWSRYAKKKFERAGGEAGLPSDDELEKIRQLSHRRTAAGLNVSLRDKLSFPIPLPAIEITSPEQIKDIDYDFFFKLPWSSTGRGVFSSIRMRPEKISSSIEGMINSQGSVMIEKALIPERDFAMLFNISDGICKFVGYSLFGNVNNSYSGNILAQDDMLKKELGRYVPVDWLTELEEVMPAAINEIIGTGYNGNLGIDMLVYKDSDGKNRIAPTIEINLRNTMGFVAKALTDKLIYPGKTGVFTVSFGEDEEIKASVFDNERLVKGDFLPIGHTSGFTFKVKAD